MGTTPRIGRNRNTKSTTVEPDVETAHIEALNPTAFERTLGSYDAIVQHRQREQDELLLALRGPGVPSKPTLEAVPAKATAASMIAAHINELTAQDAEQRQATRKAREAKNREVIKPLAERLAIVKRGLAALRDEHLLSVAEIAALDVMSYIRRVPVRITAGSLVTNHTHVGSLVNAAKNALSMQTGTEDAERAIALLEMAAGAHAESQEWRRAHEWAERQIKVLETTLASATHSVATMQKYLKLVEADLQLGGEIEPAPLPERTTLPRVENPPAPAGGSSIPDWSWDVRDRSTYREPGKGDVPTEKIDDVVGGGHRVGALPDPGTKGKGVLR
jgi:hypothetical protein